MELYVVEYVYNPSSQAEAGGCELDASLGYVSEWGNVKNAHTPHTKAENMYLVLRFYQVVNKACHYFDIQALKIFDLWNCSHLDSKLVSGKECQQINIRLKEYI